MEEKAQRRIAHVLATLRTPTEDSVEIKDFTNEFSVLHTEECAAKKTPPPSDDDVVVVCALRTPIGKAKRGAFKDTHPTDLLAAVLKGVIDKTKLDPKLVGDIHVGTVLAPGGGATQARMAMFMAGFPESVPITTVNRQCSSGLQAFANIAAAIKSGFIDIGIGAGVESMSQHDMVASVGEINPKAMEVQKAKECLISMGETSENVAEQFGISREKQDKMGVESQQKALKAQKEGRFKDEIVPVTTVVKTDQGDKTVTVTQDEGPRATTLEGLAKLKPAFKEGGSTTAGTSSQVSDGAAAVLAMRRSTAKKLGYQPLLTFRSFAVVGVPPAIMGVGPAFAIPEALKKANLAVKDIDIYEINEAFASQATYCIEKLGIPMDRVNPNGGAIALGHPLGCTGARQIATLASELKRSNGRYGVVSMCIGTGMGAAAVFERE
jgi:acetyl-CoA acyltransferase 1